MQKTDDHLDTELLREVESHIGEGYLRRVSVFYPKSKNNMNLLISLNHCVHEPVRSHEVAKLIGKNEPDKRICIVVTLFDGRGILFYIKSNNIEGTEERESHEEAFSSGTKRFLEERLDFA